MAKSESATQEWTLATVETGLPVDVIRVLAEDPTALLVHGIRAGVCLTIDSDAPFGGPRIVGIGRRRVAVDRRLAQEVLVAPAARASDAGRVGRQ